MTEADKDKEKVIEVDPKEAEAQGMDRYYCPKCGHTFYSPSWPSYCPKWGCTGNPKRC